MRNDWKNLIPERMNNYCNGCDVCDGHTCAGQLPGMGGLGEGLTFQDNYNSWQNIEIPFNPDHLPELGVAPMTGVGENMGNPCSEAEFHKMLVKGAVDAGVFSCIGDGTPDHKLEDGAEALRSNNVKGYVFFKPYSNNMLFERYEKTSDCAVAAGLDIDSYRIVTMKGKASLEKKTAAQLFELKKYFKLPFMVKGVASEEDVQLVEKVKPDIVVISNHGGRVFDKGRGTAYILHDYGKRLKNCCGQLWVDGGLRSAAHLAKAASLGADRVLIGRPFIQATAVFGEKGIGICLDGWGL